MNILLVDDDSYVLEGLKNGLKWDNLPFTSRYKAKNVKTAKKIINSIPIHVLLCDIEMPQESGLDLLEWIRSSGIDLEAIFLTSYADFNYAQKALELGSFNYFLKPVDYEKLSRILLDAANKVNESKLTKEYLEYGKYWVASEQARLSAFWRQNLHAEYTDNENEMERLCNEARLNYTDSDCFIIMACHYSYPDSHDWRDSDVYNYQLNVITDNEKLVTSTPSIHKECIISENKNLKYLIYRIIAIEENNWIHISNVASHIKKSKYVNNNFKDFAIYISEAIHLKDICRQVIMIDQMMFNSIIYGNGIFFVTDNMHKKSNLISIDFNDVLDKMMCGNLDDVLKYIDRLIDKTAQDSQISYTLLRQLIWEWTEVTYMYLHKQQANALQLFSTEEYKEKYENGLKNISLCKDCLIFIVRKSMDYVKSIQQSDNIISKIKLYISEHLSEPMSRSSLGQAVCLNPDYLANLFKKETGLSIKKYINEQRLESSKELLLTTNLPIYTIAIKVGFPTSSYFSKQFKKMYNCEPSDMRNMH